MKIVSKDRLDKKNLKNIDGILAVVRLSAGSRKISGKIFASLDKASRIFLEKYVAGVKMRAGDVKMVPFAGRPSRVFVAVLDDNDEKNIGLIFRKFVRFAKAEGLENLAVAPADFSEKSDEPAVAEILTREAIIAHYDFSEFFKTPPKGGFSAVKNLVIFLNDLKNIKPAIARGRVVGEAVNRARTLSNYPPGEMTPEGLAEAARESALKNSELEISIFDERKMEILGMNAILAVGKGSANPPRLIMMEYRGGAPNEAPLILAGKGITFDSGGLNIKTGDGMGDMHMDMSGGASVIAAIGAIAELRIPVNVIGIVAAAENMPSGFSYRQGDIIKSFGGKTIEIGNTDAEGRVVLADAISYALTRKPALIVTLATLTGAAMVALGTRRSGLFVKNNKNLRDEFEKIGEESGDLVWPLPLFLENERDVEGIFADVTNTHKNHSRYGGASTGAGFLSSFAGSANFVHIDMAPRMIANTDEEQLAKGSVGFGVRFFIGLAKNWQTVKNVIMK